MKPEDSPKDEFVEFRNGSRIMITPLAPGQEPLRGQSHFWTIDIPALILPDMPEPEEEDE